MAVTLIVLKLGDSGTAHVDFAIWFEVRLLSFPHKRIKYALGFKSQVMIELDRAFIGFSHSERKRGKFSLLQIADGRRHQ